MIPSTVASLIVFLILILVIWNPKLEKLEDVVVQIVNQTDLKARIKLLENNIKTLTDDIRLLKIDLGHAEDRVSRASVWHKPELEEVVRDIRSSISNRVDEITISHSRILEAKQKLI